MKLTIRLILLVLAVHIAVLAAYTLTLAAIKAPLVITLIGVGGFAAVGVFNVVEKVWNFTKDK